MMNKTIIGFAGRKRAGKTMLSTHMCKKHSGSIVTIADSLKKLCCELLSIDTIDELNRYKDTCSTIFYPSGPGNYNIAEWSEIISKSVGIDVDTAHHEIQTMFEKYGASFNIRDLLQYVGTNIIRKYYPSWHVDRMVENIINADTKYVFVDDVRFPDEREAIERLGGKVYFIIRPDTTIDVSNHSSETSLHWFDFEDNAVILNYLSKEFLCGEFVKLYGDNVFHSTSQSPIIRIGCGLFNNVNDMFGVKRVDVSEYEKNMISSILEDNEFLEYGNIRLIRINPDEARNTELLLKTEKKEIEYGPHMFNVWNPYIIENLKEWF